MANNLKQKFSRLFKKEPVPSELAQLEIKPDMKPVDVVDACINFIKQNSENLDFDDNVTVTDYDNNTIYAMSRQKNGQYNYTKYFTDGKVIVGYYFSLKLSVFSFDTVYELRFLDDTKFTFSKEDTEPKVYQKVENLFNLLSKNYDKAEARRKAEREKLAQKELDNAVAYIKSHLGKTEAKNVNKEQKPMTRLDLIKACQELVNSPNVMILSVPYSGEHMDSKTFYIMQKSKYLKPIIFQIEHNIFYYIDTDGSHTRYDRNIGPTDIGVLNYKKTFFFETVNDQTFVEAGKLVDMCESKQTVLEKPLKIPTKIKIKKLGTKIEKMDLGERLMVFYIAAMMGPMVFMPIGFAGKEHLDKKNKAETKENIEQPIQTQEEVLSNQKQLFELYRDILMNGKVRE